MVPNLSSDEQAAAEFMTAELRRLHESARPQRQPGEFTVVEYMEAQTSPMTRNAATGELNRKVDAGELEKPPQRFIDGRMMNVYKLVAKAE